MTPAKERLCRDIRDLGETMETTGQTVQEMADKIEDGEMSIETAREIAVNKQYWALVRALEGV
jgi:hypothetical protein